MIAPVIKLAPFKQIADKKLEDSVIFSEWQKSALELKSKNQGKSPDREGAERPFPERV